MVFNFFANATESVSWVPNPTTRGTSNIIQSCLITTSLCVWTALHLNVKEPDDPTFLRISYQTWRKAGWLMIGLLAPEMVVYTAWYQRSEAKGFRDMYNRRFGLKLPPGKLKRAYRWLFHREGKERTIAGENLSVELEAAQHHKQTSATARHEKIPWTLAQGFYAQMGGFALDTIGAYPEFLPETLTIIDKWGFRRLLREGFSAVPVGVMSQDTTHENEVTGELPSPQRHSFHQEQETGLGQQQINEVEFTLAENTPNEEHAVAKARVESDKSNIGAVRVETSGYNFYRPLDISKKYLQEKSKANGLAKSLVCLQASWFCVQCLVRVGQALPVTLLEINTFAHSVCALLVYILWWYKPLDVEQPTYLPVKGVDAVRRWSELDKRSYSHSTRFNEYPHVVISGLKTKLRITRPTRAPVREEQVMVLKALWLREEPLKEVPSEFKKFISEAEAVKLDGTRYPGILIRDAENHGAVKWGTWYPYPDRNLPSCMSYYYSVRIRKVSDASHWDFLLKTEGVEGVETVVLNRSSTRRTRIPNWPSFDIRKPWIQLLFLFVAFIYGGLHSLAWNALFPSPTQRLLWQISSSVIMGAGVPALICYFLSEEMFISSTELFHPQRDGMSGLPIYVRRWRIYTFRLSKPILNYKLYCILGRQRYALLQEIREQRAENDTSPLPIIWKELPFLYYYIDNFLVGIIALLLPAYLFARIYLVVESFIQLFHLKPGPVFEQPLWSSYIPHLG